MALNFRKSKSFGPIRINMSQSGFGASVGFGGLRAGIDSKGRSYSSVNIPGTGFTNRSYTSSSIYNDIKVSEDPEGRMLGFIYNTEKYREKDSKGCAKILVWMLSICLIPVGIGVFTTAFLYVRHRIKSAKPENKFRNNFVDGYILMSSKKYEQALEKLNIAEAAKPNELDLIDLKGVCLYNLDRIKEAYQYFKRAWEMDSLSERRRFLYVETLIALGDEKDCPEIIRILENDLRIQFDERRALILANCFSIVGEYDKAISYFQKLPKDSEYYLKSLYGIATCFYKKNEINLAIDVLNKAPLRTKNFDDDLVRIVYVLGELYEETGDIENAKAMYQRVYAHDINYQEVKQRLDNLN